MTGLLTVAAICAVLFIYAVRFDARMESRRRTRDADKFRCWVAANRIRQIAADTLARECDAELDAAMEQACALTLPPTLDALVADTAAFQRAAAQIRALPEVAL